MRDDSMNDPMIVGIYITDRATVLPHAVESAEAVAGLGLVGDRYHLQQGTFSTTDPNDMGRDLTLIENEAIEQFRTTYGMDLTPEEARRNLVTQGVALNDLIGKEFYIGEVRVKGIRVCAPCKHMQTITGKPVLEGLANSGGLRADILQGGVIGKGDRIREV
jgi:MOSC domain-containing protein YiiM